MNQKEWLSYGAARQFFEFTNNPFCGMGLHINHNSLIDVDVYDSKFDEVKSIIKWQEYGVNHGYANNFGCNIHEYSENNVQLTWHKAIAIHPEKLYNNFINNGDSATLLTDPINIHYHGYMASLPEIMQDLINKARQISDTNTFIDIGCGRGKVLSYAKQYYNNLIGIDFEQTLINDAKEIVPTATLHVGYAELFDLPDIHSHIYMFSPFDNTITIKFLDKNINNIIKNKSLIIFHSPIWVDHLFKEYNLIKLYENQDGGIYGTV